MQHSVTANTSRRRTSSTMILQSSHVGHGTGLGHDQASSAQHERAHAYLYPVPATPPARPSPNIGVERFPLSLTPMEHFLHHTDDLMGRISAGVPYTMPAIISTDQHASDQAVPGGLGQGSLQVYSNTVGNHKHVAVSSPSYQIEARHDQAQELLLVGTGSQFDQEAQPE